MIGKILADRWGWTEKLGGVNNEAVKITTEVEDGKLRQLKKDIQDCNTTAQVDVVIKEHGLSDIEGLPQHIKELYEKGEIGKLKVSDINDFIQDQNQTQNFQNIANQASGFKGVNAAIEEYNALTDTASKSKLAETINGTNKSLGKYLTGLNGAEAGMDGYAGSLVIATARTITLQAVTMALNAGISMVVSLVIGKLITGITNLANSVENCKERVDELMSSYESALDTANSNAETVENLADRYEELSKGVNSLGQNVTLTADEYAEYNEIVDQIADMFPTMIQGYTDEGTAILSLKGNVEELRDACKEAQQEAYNTLIASDDIVDNWNNLNNTKWYNEILDGGFGNPDVGKSISTSEAIELLYAHKYIVI